MVDYNNYDKSNKNSIAMVISNLKNAPLLNEKF
jgi:hypothetical protein